MSHEFEEGVNGALQRRLRDMQPEIDATPALANGGRLLNVLEPEAIGWDRVRALARRDGVLALTAVPEAATRTRLQEILEPGMRLATWRVFLGDPGDVLPRVDAILADHAPPVGWRLDSVRVPDDATLAQIARLNAATGVRPTPGYYLRGEACPSMTTVLRDGEGALVGCGNATMRYHPESRLAGTLFAGAVSVDPAHRGRRFGTLVNAALLRDSHRAFRWRQVLEQAREENAASCAMLRQCGLAADPVLATFAILCGDGEFTR